MDTIYFEEIKVGKKISTQAEYIVTKEEIIDFASKWDPLPFHIDEGAAKTSVFGGLIASSCHVMAMRTWLLNKQNEIINIPVLAVLAWDEVRFPNPVRPGDRLSLTTECIEKRELRNKADRGILKSTIAVKNQNDEPVLVQITTNIVAKRP